MPPADGPPQPMPPKYAAPAPTPLVFSKQVEEEVAAKYPHLAGGHMPRADGSTVTLPSGRILGYAEHVDPACPPDQLKTVVLLPGTPGCRLFTHPALQATGGVLPGCRLLVLERPGIGLSSDPPPNYSYADFVTDFQHFCELLSLPRGAVHLIGYSAGTPYAAAAACLAGPGTLASVALVSTIGPPDTPNARRNMSLLFKFAYFASWWMPWLVAAMVRSEARAFRRRPLRALHEAFKPYAALPADATALARPEVEGSFLESALEVYGRQQEHTIVRECLQFTRPWGFDLTACRVPVAIWQGEGDLGCTREMAQHMGALLPGARVTLVPGAGHMVYFDEPVWRQMLTWLLGGYKEAVAGEAPEAPDGAPAAEATTQAAAAQE